MFKGNKRIIAILGSASWEFWRMTFGFHFPTTRNSLVFNAQMGNPKSTGTKHPLRDTKPTRLGLEQHVKYIFHQHGAWLGGCEWIIASILVWNILETRFLATPRPRRLQLKMAWASRLGVLLLWQWLWLEVDTGLCLAKCNLNLLQSRMKETADVQWCLALYPTKRIHRANGQIVAWSHFNSHFDFYFSPLWPLNFVNSQLLK